MGDFAGGLPFGLLARAELAGDRSGDCCRPGDCCRSDVALALALKPLCDMFDHAMGSPVALITSLAFDELLEGGAALYGISSYGATAGGCLYGG